MLRHTIIQWTSNNGSKYSGISVIKWEEGEGANENHENTLRPPFSFYKNSNLFSLFFFLSSNFVLY